MGAVSLHDQMKAEFRRPSFHLWTSGNRGTESDAAICPACLRGTVPLAHVGVREPDPYHPGVL